MTGKSYFENESSFSNQICWLLNLIGFVLVAQ